SVFYCISFLITHFLSRNQSGWLSRKMFCLMEIPM
uniref:Mediator complex subunit 10 n=1 Tax=Aegilops tauschii subsp. strangulata TaxID=200361 RepID=A0A453LE04_AEGTS